METLNNMGSEEKLWPSAEWNRQGTLTCQRGCHGYREDLCCPPVPYTWICTSEESLTRSCLSVWWSIAPLVVVCTLCWALHLQTGG